MTLSETESKILMAMGDIGSDWVSPFKYISGKSGIELSAIRPAVRSLAAKGFAYYKRGLFNDSGEVAGSGYGITEAGWQLYLQMLEDAA